MGDATHRRWHRWRFTTAKSAPVSRANRLRLAAPVAPAPKPCHAEQPGADGIRHELVARIRAEIAAGTYDTEEKWLAAEEELLRRIEERT